MEDGPALKRADEMLMAFIASQDIPPGGTTGTAREHGEKTAQFLIGIHRTLYEYFRGLEDAGARGSGR